MENELKKDLLSISKDLASEAVSYLLIGGTAVGIYGYVRPSAPLGFAAMEMTHDLDFWYKPTIENFERLLNVINKNGIERDKLDQIVFDPKKTFLRIPKNNYKLEFLCQIDGVSSFDKAFERRKVLHLEGQEINVISYQDLLSNKKATNRSIDRTDIEELEKRKKKD